MEAVFKTNSRKKAYKKIKKYYGGVAQMVRA
jgi:hypothetical protein